MRFSIERSYWILFLSKWNWCLIEIGRECRKFFSGKLDFHSFEIFLFFTPLWLIEIRNRFQENWLRNLDGKPQNLILDTGKLLQPINVICVMISCAVTCAVTYKAICSSWRFNGFQRFRSCTLDSLIMFSLLYLDWFFGPNIYMEWLEKNAIRQSKNQPQLWLRYVDYRFVIWRHGFDALEQFFQHIVDLKPSIKFTMES